MTKDDLLVSLFPSLLKLVDDAVHTGGNLAELERARKQHDAAVWDALNAYALGLAATQRPPEME